MKRYSFQDCIMLVNGVEITGWDEGDDVIKVARRADAITDKVGAGGEMMVSVSADRSGEFTFKLQQTSSSNKFLQQLMDLQQAAGSLFVPVSVMFQDTYRSDMATGTFGYLKKPPEMTRGAAAGSQEWVVVVERLDLVFGSI
jgi:Protein of unknown function (DUF3277)